MIYFRSINNYLKGSSRLKSFSQLLVFFFIVNFVEKLIVEEILKIHLSLSHQNFSIAYLVKAVFLGPLLETFIFQFIIIEFLLYLKKSKFLSVISSGLLFGFLHLFNSDPIFYFIFATIAGTFFAYVYILYKQKLNTNPFLMVFLLHSTYNFGVFIFNNFENIINVFE